VGQVMVRAEGLMRAKVQQMAGLDVMMGGIDCEIDPPCGAAVAVNLGIRARASTCVCVLACLHVLASVWFCRSAHGV